MIAEPGSPLASLREEVLGCTKCDLCKSRRHAIFGEGNPAARIMIIGEAPGYDEDVQGRPFVGKSGQLLDKILAACGFTRTQHVFISNIVKCRPPGNRTPSLKEAEVCMPYLKRQIEIINPEFLVLLGATALRYMVGEKYKITAMRGTWIDIEGRKAMPVYHPAALLRNPALKRPTWEDFKALVWKYREIVNPQHHAEQV